ncbi:unnamed protein product [Brachionus calyciflorus]|uniref:FHA domain-containing protein n=1 Tax=Brachionus calyciflorus TaxID=104777 RepID=A0A813PUE3_9BILA|nr:unnamed protein product [Brachionus calyciflorus]
MPLDEPANIYALYQSKVREINKIGRPSTQFIEQISKFLTNDSKMKLTQAEITKIMKSKSKGVRKLKGPLLNVAKSMGKWRSQDDFMLVQSILHLENLEDVHQLVKFTNKFTQKELEERWFAFLYDEPISKMIRKNMKKLHIDDIARLEKQIPFNNNENFLLLGLDSKLEPTNEFFEDFLLKHRVHFHSARTVNCLRKQFLTLKKLNLLKDQIINENSEYFDGEIEFEDTAEQLDNFERIEKGLEDEQINTEIELDEKNEKDMSETYEALLENIRKAEADLFLWQSLIDKLNGVSNPFEDPSCLAVIFSENFNYTMSKREISFGRSKNADIDLSPHELFSKKISRNQFKIVMLDSNLFILINNGRLQVYVDGKVIQKNDRTQIFDKSIIEIGDISMLFLVNYNNISEANLNINLLIAGGK